MCLAYTGREHIYNETHIYMFFESFGMRRAINTGTGYGGMSDKNLRKIVALVLSYTEIVTLSLQESSNSVFSFLQNLDCPSFFDTLKFSGKM